VRLRADDPQADNANQELPGTATGQQGPAGRIKALRGRVTE